MTRLLLGLVLLLSALCVSDVSYSSTADGTYFSSGNTNTTPSQSAYGLVVRPIDGFLKSGEDQTNNVIRTEYQWEYEDVAASQTDQAMGATGAAGDLLHALKCFTSAASVGAVTVKDGLGSAFTIFLAQSGAAILDSPPLDWVSVNGAWSVTTGTNTTCKVSGRFS